MNGDLKTASALLKSPLIQADKKDTYGRDPIAVCKDCKKGKWKDCVKILTDILLDPTKSEK